MIISFLHTRCTGSLGPTKTTPSADNDVGPRGDSRAPVRRGFVEIERGIAGRQEAIPSPPMLFATKETRLHSAAGTVINGHCPFMAPITNASNGLRLDFAKNEYHTVHFSTHSSTHSNHVANRSSVYKIDFDHHKLLAHCSDHGAWRGAKWPGSSKGKVVIRSYSGVGTQPNKQKGRFATRY